MVRAQDAFLVSYQPLADHDGLRRAVAELAQEPGCPPSEPDHGTVQVTAGRAPGRGLIQGHDLLHQLPGDGPVLMPGLVQRVSQPVEQPRSRLADRGQGAVSGQVLPDHPHHQPVRADRGPIHGEGQQRRPGQPRQHPVRHLRRQRRHRPLPVRQALPGRRMDQRPAHPGRRQHRHQVHHRRARPALVTGPDSIQRQQHRRRYPLRVLPGLLRGQQIRDRQAAQPVQVGSIGQELAGDHRRGLRQRQRQAPQLPSQHPGPGGVGPPGPGGQERQRLRPRRTHPPARPRPGTPLAGSCW